MYVLLLGIRTYMYVQNVASVDCVALTTNYRWWSLREAIPIKIIVRIKL